MEQVHVSNLAIRLLGNLEVIRDGETVPLPPSKKTRGLLAYLALSERALRREQLCELLWEIPDDPRGSLRWSLSKIRKLVDHRDQPRIIADRSTVAFDTSTAHIDVLELHSIAENGLDQVPTGDLINAAQGFQGGFLEDLELPNFHDFYTWSIGEREHANRSQAALLKELVQRLDHQPEQAVNYASRLATLLPLDESALAALVTTLLQLERKQEAEHHYRSALEKLAGAGIEADGELYRAWRAQGKQRSKTKPSVTAPQKTRRSSSPHKDVVGRDVEIQLLESLISQLSAGGKAQALLLRGEPGLGKSRLLQVAAALARESGAGIFKASAFESERIRPFAVWNDALRRAVPDNPTSALLTSGDRVSRDQVFTSLSDLVREESNNRPLLVLFDDAHWCDESSASAMLYVLRMNRRQPVLVVAAARDNELKDNEAVMQCIRGLRQESILVESRLEPLQASALAQLISRQYPDTDAEALSRECGGNPLLALELARAVQSGGSGTSLSELVQERMSHLAEDAVDVLQWAALLAPNITVEALKQATGLERDAIDSVLEEAERQGILHPGERGFRFSHDLISRSIYQDISPARQQAMHRQVAERLEQDTALDLGLASDLAHHAQRSGDPALAARAMVSAGRLCLRFYANDQALELYDRGLALAQQLDDAERVCTTLELCEIRQAAGTFEDWEATVREYIALAEQALDHGALPHARLGYQLASVLRWNHGQWSAAQRDSLQAERVSRAADDGAQVLGMAEAAKCLAMLERDLSAADAMAMEAYGLAQRNQLQCPQVYLSLGILRYYEGRMGRAVEHLEDARTQCKTQGDRVDEFLANEYLALIEIDRGDYLAAQGPCAALVEIGTRLREGSEAPLARAMEQLCLYATQGDDGGIDAAMDLLRQADAKQRLTVVLNRAALLDLESGKTESAQQRAVEASLLAEFMERPSEQLYAHTTLANISLKNNEVDLDYHIEVIIELCSGPVAAWARERASILLNSRE
jgi:DNA-binding SARP family transcriptional activator